MLAYFQYVQDSDWEKTAFLMDPQALADMRDMFLPMSYLRT